MSSDAQAESNNDDDENKEAMNEYKYYDNNQKKEIIVSMDTLKQAQSTQMHLLGTDIDRNFIGGGTECLHQFNGYYKTSSAAFVNLQVVHFYFVDEKMPINNQFQILYSLDGKCGHNIKNGKAWMADKDTAILTWGQNNKLVFKHEWSFHYGSGHHWMKNGYILSTVTGIIENVKVHGYNYLNLVHLDAFAGGYNYLFPFISKPTIKGMTITKDGGCLVDDIIPVPFFGYYPSMYTLINIRDEALMFLGTVSSGLFALQTDPQHTYAASAYNYNSIKDPNLFDPAILHPHTVHILAPFSGYYAFEKRNCFFNVCTTVEYSKYNPKGKYVIRITYSIDGNTIQNPTHFQIGTDHDSSVVTLTFSDFTINLRKPTGPNSTSIITELNGTFGRGVNKTNLTPLSLFAASYTHQVPLANSKLAKDVPYLEITNDEKVFIFNQNEKTQILNFTYAGTMYLLSFDHDKNRYMFMLGIRPIGLCVYGMISSLETEKVIKTFLLNAIGDVS